MTGERIPVGFASTASTKETVSSQVVLNLEDGKLISVQSVPEKTQQEVPATKSEPRELEPIDNDDTMTLTEVAAEFIERAASILSEAEDSAMSINDAHSRSEMLASIADKYVLYAISLLNGTTSPIVQEQQPKNKQLD